jgi:hypothetical protein
LDLGCQAYARSLSLPPVLIVNFAFDKCVSETMVVVVVVIIIIMITICVFEIAQFAEL